MFKKDYTPTVMYKAFFLHNDFSQDLLYKYQACIDVRQLANGQPKQGWGNFIFYIFLY